MNETTNKSASSSSESFSSRSIKPEEDTILKKTFSKSNCETGGSWSSSSFSSFGYEEDSKKDHDSETTKFLSSSVVHISDLKNDKDLNAYGDSEDNKMKEKLTISVINNVDNDCLKKISNDNLTLNHKNLENGLSTLENIDTAKKEKKVRTGFLGRYLGIILALFSSLLFPLAGLIVKSMPQYHTFSVTVWRFQGILLPAIPIAIYYRCYKKEKIFDTVLPITGKWKTVCFLLLRGISGATAVVLQFYSLRYISMADSMVISFCTPVFVTLVAHLFLGEKCGIISIISGFIVILGVGVITRPPLLTGEEEFDQDNLIGASLAFGCMIFATLTFVLLRYLRQLHYSMINLFFGFWGTGETLILSLIANTFQFPQGTQDWLMAIALALITFLAQTAITLAFKFEQAGTISLCRTTDVIFAFLWQFLFLGVVPDRYSVIGASIVMFGILLIGCRKWISELPESNKKRSQFSWILK